MLSLGFEPGTARWYAQMNPLSNGAPVFLLDDITALNSCIGMKQVV